MVEKFKTLLSNKFIDNILIAMKICIECNTEFNPSSRHKKCPKCRDIELKHPCIDCGKPVFKRSTRCLSCSTKHHHQISPLSDEFSEFRTFIRRARRRNKLGDISLKDLKEQWDIQKGICPYSGVKLQLPSESKSDPLITASLDRIDSNLSYSKGNIQYVSIAINYMKNTLSHEEVLKLCKSIAAVWKI